MAYRISTQDGMVEFRADSNLYTPLRVSMLGHLDVSTVSVGSYIQAGPISGRTIDSQPEYGFYGYSSGLGFLQNNAGYQTTVLSSLSRLPGVDNELADIQLYTGFNDGILSTGNYAGAYGGNIQVVNSVLNSSSETAVYSGTVTLSSGAINGTAVSTVDFNIDPTTIILDSTTYTINGDYTTSGSIYLKTGIADVVGGVQMTLGNNNWEFAGTGALKLNGGDAGATGQVLTSTGPNTQPSWQYITFPPPPDPILVVSPNVLIGRGSLVIPGGIQNISIGNSSLANNLADNNIAIGTVSMQANTTGIQNIALGINSLNENLTGDNNVAIGPNAMQHNTSGFQNVAIGNSAGINIIDGSNITCIGLNSGPDTGFGSVNNSTYIGFGAISTGAGPGTGSNEIILGNSSISYLECHAALSNVSDLRDKKNIKPLEFGLDFVSTLKPVSFAWNMRDGGKIDVKSSGFIAQDLQAAQEAAGASDILNLVNSNNPDKLTAAYTNLIPVLVKAIQDLKAEVDALKAQLVAK